MAKRPASKARSDAATPAKPKARRPRAAKPAAPPPLPEPTVDDIRRRAYERYLERGGRHGHPFDDWVEAEKELRGRK